MVEVLSTSSGDCEVMILVLLGSQVEDTKSEILCATRQNKKAGLGYFPDSHLQIKFLLLGPCLGSRLLFLQTFVLLFNVDFRGD
jgi:hypothetical protein